MLGTVLLKPLVAQFAMVEAVLDEVEDVLDPAAGLCFEPLNPLDQVFHLACGQTGHLAALSGDGPFHLPVLELLALLGAGITRIGKSGLFLTVQQVARLGHLSPAEALGQWQEKRPELFVSKVDNLPGLGS